MIHSVLRWFRRLTQYAPTQWYAALVVVCAPVWLFSGTPRGQVAATVVAGLLVLIGLVDAIRIPGKPNMTVTRTLSPTIGIGDTNQGTYKVLSTWPVQVQASLTHALPDSIDGLLGQATVPLTPGDPVTVPLTVTGRVRGQYGLGLVAVTVSGPFQLFRRTLVYDLNDTITVIPSTAGIRQYRLLAEQQRSRSAGQRVLRRRGSGTAFANLREYTTGDDPRHIDWKASARRQRLISREFTIEQGQTIMLAIDAGRMMTQIAGDRPRFEYALAAALTLANVALTTGDRVGLIVFNEEVRRYLAPGRGPDTLTHIRDALTGVTATMAEPDYAAAFRTVTARHRRRSLLVVFTDVIDIRSSRAIVAYTVRSATCHLPLIVALRNDQLVHAAIPSDHATDEATYQSVAAEELLSARDEVLLTMRQAGVAVLDTAPTALTAAVINRYLDIKDRALL